MSNNAAKFDRMVRVEPTLYRKLAVLALMEQRGPKEIVEEALKQYLATKDLSPERLAEVIEPSTAVAI